jgi:formiminoglutamate deiminase
VPLATRWHCEHAWLGPGRVASGVVIQVEGERITRVEAGGSGGLKSETPTTASGGPGRPSGSPPVNQGSGGLKSETPTTASGGPGRPSGSPPVNKVPPPPDARVLRGLTLPGFANAHSHAFHRLLRGRTHRAGGDFWRWRELMYQAAATLDPDGYHQLARAVFAEMALAGWTAVGEFHYLHHQPGGRPYQDPNAMGAALCAAAAEVGIRLTLLDTCYLWAGVGRQEPGPVQRRFSDGTPAAWAARVERLRREAEAGTLPGAAEGLVRVGAAIHSVRAVAPDELGEVAAWARAAGAPLHVHLSEQAAENHDCLAHTGLRPAALLDEAGALGPGTTAVHATHLDAGDLRRLGAAGGFACLCPTTERDLGDGIGPAAELRDAGARLCVGSDSNTVVDPFEETRAVELDDRLRLERRGIHDPDELLVAATANGYASLGWEPVGLRSGSLADFVTVSLASRRLAGSVLGEGGAADLAAAVLFAAAPDDVTDVVIGGREVVAGGRHARYDDVAGLLTAAARRLRRG